VTTWRIPDQPGPEIQAIRTQAYLSRLLVRVDDADGDGKTWWYYKHSDGTLGGRCDWDYLIRNEVEIRDATHELPQPPSP
jgi:hypothetical protein